MNEDMLRTAHQIITGLMIALGLIHLSVTFADYDTFSLGALWFASAGVAIVLAGFLNVILLRDAGGRDKVVRLLCVFTNIIFAAMFGAALILMRQPQIFVGLALFIIAAITSLTVNKAD